MTVRAEVVRSLHDLASGAATWSPGPMCIVMGEAADWIDRLGAAVDSHQAELGRLRRDQHATLNRAQLVLHRHGLAIIALRGALEAILAGGLDPTTRAAALGGLEAAERWGEEPQIAATMPGPESGDGLDASIGIDPNLFSEPGRGDGP